MNYIKDIQSSINKPVSFEQKKYSENQFNTFNPSLEKEFNDMASYNTEKINYSSNLYPFYLKKRKEFKIISKTHKISKEYNKLNDKCSPNSSKNYSEIKLKKNPIFKQKIKSSKKWEKGHNVRQNTKSEIKQTEIDLLKNIGKNLINEISSAMNVQNEVLICIKENQNLRQNSHEKKDKVLKTENIYNIDDVNSVTNNSKNIKAISSLEKDNIYSKKQNGLFKNVVIGKNKLPIQEYYFPTPKLNFNKIASYKNLSGTSFIHTRLVISYNSSFKILWDCIIFITIIYTVFITPIFLCFYQEVEYLKFIEIAIEFAMLIDIFLCFFTSYIDEEDNIVANLNMITKNYICNWFILDLFTVIQFELIDHFLGNNYTLFYLDYNWFIKIDLFKWSKMFKMTKLFRSGSLANRFINQVVLNDNYTINRVLKFSFLFFILSHIASCFFIFLGNTFLNQDNWITKFDLQDATKGDVYIASLYYILVTIYTIGYGDITPVNIYEKLCVIIFMFIGSVLYSYAVSSLSTMFCENSKKYNEYKQKLSILNIIDKEFFIPSGLYNKLVRTISYEYKKNENEKYELLDSLPSNLRNELMIIINGKIPQDHIFFKNQQNNFILKILPLLKHHSVSQGDILFSVGDIIDEMYFVQKGRLGINLGPHYRNMGVAKISKNEHFGDIFLHLNEPSQFELTCISKSADVLVLKKSDFIKIKECFNNNVLDILEESFHFYKKILNKRLIYIELYKHFNEPKEIYKKYKIIRMYFFLTAENENIDDDILNKDLYDFISELGTNNIINIFECLEKSNSYLKQLFKNEQITIKNVITTKAKSEKEDLINNDVENMDYDSIQRNEKKKIINQNSNHSFKKHSEFMNLNPKNSKLSLFRESLKINNNTEQNKTGNKAITDLSYKEPIILKKSSKYFSNNSFKKIYDFLDINIKSNQKEHFHKREIEFNEKIRRYNSKKRSISQHIQNNQTSNHKHILFSKFNKRNYYSFNEKKCSINETHKDCSSFTNLVIQNILDLNLVNKSKEEGKSKSKFNCHKIDKGGKQRISDIKIPIYYDDMIVNSNKDSLTQKNSIEIYNVDESINSHRNISNNNSEIILNKKICRIEVLLKKFLNKSGSSSKNNLGLDGKVESISLFS